MKKIVHFSALACGLGYFRFAAYSMLVSVVLIQNEREVRHQILSHPSPRR